MDELINPLTTKRILAACTALQTHLRAGKRPTFAFAQVSMIAVAPKGGHATEDFASITGEVPIVIAIETDQGAKRVSYVDVRNMLNQCTRH